MVGECAANRETWRAQPHQAQLASVNVEYWIYCCTGLLVSDYKCIMSWDIYAMMVYRSSHCMECSKVCFLDVFECDDMTTINIVIGIGQKGTSGNTPVFESSVNLSLIR